MFKFLQTNTTDKTVEIIKAIGSCWPLVLIIILTIFLIIYRNNIGKFFSGMKKVSGETPVGKISIERNNESITSESLILDKKTIEEDVNEQKEEKKDLSDNKASFFDVSLQLQKHEDLNAENLFTKIQEEEKDPIKKEKNLLYMLYLRYSYGGTNTLAELEKKFNDSTNQELKTRAAKYLGDSFFEAKNYATSEKWLRIALSTSVSEEEKGVITISIANCLFESGQKQVAILFLKESKNNFTNPIIKSKIFKKISDFFEKENDWISRCLALEVAIENDPNNTELLFSTAYAYSDNNKNSREKLTPLTLLHYKDLVGYDNESSGGLNNLGVAYSELKLESKAVESYKKSANQNNTLATANLAYKYMQVGFNEEAKELLDEAKVKDDVHENVWAALKKVSDSSKEEDRLEGEIMHRAKQVQIFLREFATIYFNPNPSPLEIVDGTWKVKDSIISPKQLPNPEYYEFSWSDETNNYTVSINIKKLQVSIEKGEYVKIGGGIIEKLTAFVILFDKKIKLLLYNNTESKYLFFEFIKE